MQDFVCRCCGSKNYSPAGAYAIPMGGNMGNGMGAAASEMSYPLASCANCGHVAAFPHPSDVHIKEFYGSQAFWKGHGVDDSFAEMDWRQTLTANSSLWERYNRAANQLDYILAHNDLSKDARIIDLGSGYSPFLYHCKQRGFQNLYALEPSDEICGFLGEKGITAYPMLLEDFIEDASTPEFDLMVISHTVEHLIEPDKVLKGLWGKLSTNGALYVDVPYMDHLRPFHQGLHLHFFNEKSMAEMLSRCGFRENHIQADHFNLLERMIVSVLYFIYGIKFKNRGGVSTNSGMEKLHCLFWRPLKSILNLRINIFISSMDLRVLTKR